MCLSSSLYAALQDFVLLVPVYNRSLTILFLLLIFKKNGGMGGIRTHDVLYQIKSLGRSASPLTIPRISFYDYFFYLRVLQFL